MMSFSNESELHKLKKDFLDFEKDTVEMQHELHLKRKQVEQLRKDIDEEKIKNHDFSRTVDTQKHKIEETTRNLHLALQNNQILDGKLQEKIEEINKLKLQYSLVLNESKTLKEFLHKSELEKFNLLHKVEDLEEENKRQQTFQKHHNSTDKKLFDFINEIKREIVTVDTKTKNLADVTKELKLSKQLYAQMVFLKSQIRELQVEKEKSENQIINLQTKYKKLMELLNDHKFMVKDEVKLLQLQFNECTQHHEIELESLKSCLNDYAEKFLLEKEANNVLILQDENNTKVISELKSALNKKLDLRSVEIQTDDILFLDMKKERKEIIEID